MLKGILKKRSICLKLIEIETIRRPVCVINEMPGEDAHPRLTICLVSELESLGINEGNRSAVPRI